MSRHSYRLRLWHFLLAVFGLILSWRQCVEISSRVMWWQRLAMKYIRELRTKKREDVPLICKICRTKVFTATATLLYHYRSHAGRTPTDCSVLVFWNRDIWVDLCAVCILCRNSSFTEFISLNERHWCVIQYSYATWWAGGRVVRRRTLRSRGRGFQLLPVAAVYQCQLSVSSLRGRLMSTSESWGVNGHTTRCTSPVSVVLQLRLVSSWGLMKEKSAPPYGPLRLGERTLLYFTMLSVPV